MTFTPQRQIRKNKTIALFYILVFLLSVPFWVLGAIAPSLSSVMPMHLPISAFMFICPLVAAIIVTCARKQARGTSVRQLLGRVFDFYRIRNRRWLVPLLLIMPLIMLTEYVVLKTLGVPLPHAQVAYAGIPVLFLVYFAAAACEEIGWMGYAMEAFPRQWSAFEISICMGLLWAIWHVIPFFQTGHGYVWVIWQSLATVLLRVIIVWLYMNMGGSVFAAALFHTMVNFSETLFPTNGSGYNPEVTVFLLVVALLIILATKSRAPLLKRRYSPPLPSQIQTHSAGDATALF